MRYLSLASVVGGFLLWELAGRFLVGQSLFLAVPSQIVEAAVKLWAAGVLQRHIIVSFSEFIIGYVIAIAIGLPIGLLLAVSPRFRAILSPWVDGLYATPVIAIAPLVILWFGIGIWSKVFVVVSVVIFPVIINTEAGIRSTPHNYVEAIRCFGASRVQVFLKVMIPSALPFIFAGMRLGIGRGLIGVVVGELFGSRAGLGRLIAESAETFNMPNLFVGVLLLAAAGILLTSAFHALERRIVHWT
ncbi:ABC transporter permease [Microbaculum marinum]|uniref:ABC transporter permease n=1 Tax=Microbaculum marinum TaxID=1764581 RepID=A0AAW9RRK5_9HYPH